jgi:hypothetical protein
VDDETTIANTMVEITYIPFDGDEEGTSVLGSEFAMDARFIPLMVSKGTTVTLEKSSGARIIYRPAE